MSVPACSAVMFCDRELARFLESAEGEIAARAAQACARCLADTPLAVDRFGGAVAVYGGAGSFANKVVGLGLQGPVPEADLDRVDRFFLERQCPAQVELCPLASPDVPLRLSERGYRLVGFENVLVRSMKEPPPPPVVAIDVREVSEAQAELWARTVTAGFLAREGDTASELAVEDNQAGLPTESLAAVATADGNTAYLAYIDQVAAGGASMSLHRNLAAIYGASTLPEWRRRGIQTALLAARLATASAARCDLAMTVTLPGSTSQRNVERWGFRLAYTRAILVRASTETGKRSS